MNVFCNCWIRKKSRIPFPPRSPDLTPLDFLLRDFIKDKVYRSELTILENMKDRIRNASQQISKATFKNVELSFRNKINQCIDVQSHPFK